jgi:hypothetical protein
MDLAHGHGKNQIKANIRSNTLQWINECKYYYFVELDAHSWKQQIFETVARKVYIVG